MRIGHLYALSKTPFFAGLVVDAQAYAQDATALLTHGTIGAPFYRPPLYPYIRAALTQLGFGGPWALGVTHAFVGSVSAGVLSIVAFRLVGDFSPKLKRSSSYAAGIIAALYGPLVIYDAEMLPPVWVNALLAFAYLSVTSRRTRVGWGDLFGGISLGMATTGWPPAILLGLPLVLLRRQTLVGPDRWRAPLALVVAMSLGPSLTAIHNASHGAPGLVVSGNLGINLWLGNNPQWRDTVRARPGIYYDLEYRRATQAGATTLAARESHYIRLVMEQVRQAPRDAAVRTAEKLLLFLYGGEIGRDQDVGWLRRNSLVAALSIWEWGVKFPFGLLLPLALACPARALQPRAKMIILAGAALYALVLACFVVGARYRLPIVLLLLPLAATCAGSALARVRRREETSAFGGLHLAVFIGSLVLFNLPNAYARTFAASQAELLLLQAQAYSAQHDIEEAVQLSRTAVSVSPGNPDAHVQLGQLLLRAGRPTEAASHFRRAGNLVPSSEGPWILHGHAMIALGRYDDAIYNFHEALRRNPYQREALRDLGNTYALMNHPSLAIATLRRYLGAGYRDDMASYTLAQLLLKENDTKAAIAILLELQKRHPNWTDLNEVVSRAKGTSD